MGPGYARRLSGRSARELVDRPAAHDGLGPVLDRAGSVGGVVAALDEEPVLLRAQEREAAAQLLAVQLERRLAGVERLGRRHVVGVVVGPAVPDDDRALAVARPDGALERAPRDRVVLDLDGEAL